MVIITYKKLNKKYTICALIKKCCIDVVVLYQMLQSYLLNSHMDFLLDECYNINIIINRAVMA